ncbi:MAG: phytoene desaturase family protein [Acidilobaceae archaeon]|jgi:phytoene dehydrogenase-like protein
MGYDAVVIGGGHNGLVAACSLALRGLRVAVFEQGRYIGGMASSPELWPGFRVPVGAYVLSLFKKSVGEELGVLGRLKLIPKDPGMTVLLGGGRVLSTWSNVDKTVGEIRRFSELDARAYIEWDRMWSAVTEVLDIAYSNPPVDMWELLDTAGRLLKLARLRYGAFLEDLTWIPLAPASRLLDEFFESDEVKALLVEDAVVGELLAPSSPGSALTLAHHYMGDITGVRGQWAYVAGGIGRLSEVLAERCGELGVEVHLGSRVEEIVVRDGVARGVRVNGRLYEARFILSSLDARVTLLELLPEDAVDKRLRRRLKSLKSPGASSKAILAVRELPRPRGGYAGYADRIYRSSTLTIPDVEYVERAYRDAITRGYSVEPWISINTQSYLDPSVAPEGWHLISLFVQYTSYDSPRGWGEEPRRELLENIYNVLDNYFEDIRGRVERILLLTPKDYEEMFGAPGGHIFHLNMTPDRLWINRPLPELSKYRTPVKNLYLCGSSTHPGGGVTGLPGYLAARTLLEDIGLVKRRRQNPINILVERLKKKLRIP